METTDYSHIGETLNRYLEKLAQSLPYRRRVEVAIFKDGKVLLTKNKDDEGQAWYGFPGGGTENDSDEKAAKKECLEEVGVKVENLTRVGTPHVQEGISSKKGRDKLYRGSVTRMFKADYVGKDDSILGADGDSVKYGWYEVDEAKKLLKKNSIDSSYRVDAIGV